MNKDDERIGDLDEPDAPNGPFPKLTIGQRILTALPNLDRQKSASNRTTPRPAAGRTTTRPATSGRRAADVDTELEAEDDASEEPIEPDEVIAPQDEASPRSGTAASRATGPSRGAPARRTTSTTGAGARKGDPLADMSNEELTYGIKRIDDRERRYALIAGPVGAVFGILETILAIHYNPPLHHSGHVANSVTVLYGVARVVLGGVVTLTAYTKRRSLIAFALLFLGTAIGFPFALLFWALGGWMIWRVFRYQKELTARGAAPQRGRAAQSRTAESRVGSGPKAASRSGKTDARERARTRKEARDIRRGRQPIPPGPPRTKRYTPPKPVRPRPPAPSE